MEKIIEIITLLAGAGFIYKMFISKKVDLNKFKVTEQDLKNKQEEKEEEMEAIEVKLKNIENKLKGMNPDEVEDYWNNDDKNNN